MIFKYILPFLLIGSLQARTIDETFELNLDTYREIFSSTEPLDELQEMHLLGLKLLIDTRRECKRDLYIDSKDIFELIEGREFLFNAFKNRYQQ